MKIIVDKGQRGANMRPHTATHLLHFFIDTTIGGTKQAGSWVGNDELRFDFASKDPLSHQDLTSIEQGINTCIQANYTVITEELSYKDAIARGAKAFFDEKYGETVRLVSCEGGDIKSLELCGGTHVKTTGEIGAFKIISQEAVASGVRRIVAVTGTKVSAYAGQKDTELLGIAMMLDCQVKQIPEKLEKVIKEYEKVKSTTISLQSKILHSYLSSQPGHEIKGLDTVMAIKDTMDIERKMRIHEANQLFSGKNRCIYNSEGSFALGSSSGQAKILASTLGIKGGGNDELVQGKDTQILILFS